MSDLQARLSLTELVEKHMKGRDPDSEKLIEFIQNPARQVAIRGVLEAIRRYREKPYTQQELQLISELLHMYG